MTDRRSPHGIGGAFVRRGISHHITILCPNEMGHIILPAGPMARSGGSLIVFELGTSVLAGGGTQLLPFRYSRLAVALPPSWFLLQKTKKAVFTNEKLLGERLRPE